MAYVVTLPTVQQVKAEIDADPAGLGYAAMESAQNWNGIRDALNLSRVGVAVDRRFVHVNELTEALVYSELIALTDAARDALLILFAVAANSTLDPLNANIRGFFTGAFGPATQTRINLTALTSRQGSRAEFLWGDGVVVSDTLVEAAARL